MEINGEEITKSPRTKYEIISEQITDRFKVTDIHIEDNFVFIDIISNTGFIIKKVQLFEGLVDKDDYQMLKDDSTEIKLDAAMPIVKNAKIFFYFDLFYCLAC